MISIKNDQNFINFEVVTLGLFYMLLLYILINTESYALVYTIFDFEIFCEDILVDYVYILRLFQLIPALYSRSYLKALNIL